MAGAPTVTFALCAFNQEKYVADAVLGAFAQTYAPLEIVLSDDCSTDGTFAIMEGLARSYAGPHRVRLNRNPKNLGLIAHVNKLVDISSGELIVIAAGDDVSVPERVERLVAAREGCDPKPMLIHSSVKTIDSNGNEVGTWVPPMAHTTRTLAAMARAESLYIGATGCWHRDLFREFGPIEDPDAYEDQVLGFRAALKDAVAYVSEPLVKYRVNVGMSANLDRTSMDFKTLFTRRQRDIKAVGGAYRQRLRDLHRHGDARKVQALEALLQTGIALQEKRLLFYRDAAAFLAQSFKGRPTIALQALGIEAKFALWLVIGRSRALIESAFTPRH